MRTHPDTDIVRADAALAAACRAILRDSILGTYFDDESAAEILDAGAAGGNLYVALSEGQAAGFYLVAPEGTFLVFPYLHLLAVRTDLRGRGIGAALLAHFEASMIARPGYPFRVKAFLLVADYNPKAVAFYERAGYLRAGVFTDLFAEGDTEILMCKDLGHKPGTAR